MCLGTARIPLGIDAGGLDKAGVDGDIEVCEYMA